MPKTEITRDNALEIQSHTTTCSGNPDSVEGTRLWNGYFFRKMLVSKNVGSDVQLGSTIWALPLTKIKSQNPSKQGCSVRKLGSFISSTKDFR